ncbi:hypothetical protein Btru_042520 [Bulinus truncatus]|nr:hypothetical protein Btru_042520 [Bulinus truncatus]
MGGQFDIFVPLASTEEGMELLVQLSLLTSMQYSTPTGLIGAYNHINTEWLITYDVDKQPPSMYSTSPSSLPSLLVNSNLMSWSTDMSVSNITDALRDGLKALGESNSKISRKYKDQIAEEDGEHVADIETGDMDPTENEGSLRTDKRDDERKLQDSLQEKDTKKLIRSQKLKLKTIDLSVRCMELLELIKANA